jgi:hypothetical protein
MLAPEFLGVLSSFFNFHSDEFDEEDPVQLTSDSTILATPPNNRASLVPQTGTGGSTSKIEHALAKATPEHVVNQPTGSLTLNCKIYSIEVKKSANNFLSTYPLWI